MDRRQYLRHFMVLFSGTAAAQAINLASYPFIARLYSPADFGVFAAFVAVSAIPGAVACGRFDLAIPTAPSFGRFAILWLCLLFASGMGAVSALGGAAYWWGIEGTIDPLLPLLLGLCVFFTGFCMAAGLYLLRQDWYRVRSASLLARTGGAVLLQIGLAFVWPEPLSLILGFVAGIGLQALIFAWTIWHHVPPRPPRRGQLRAIFRRYKRQVAFDIPSTLVAALSYNLLTFMLVLLYGDIVVGLYALGLRIAVMPLQLFNDSLSEVFFQKAARAQREQGHFWPEMKFNLLTSGAVSLAALLGLWLLAHPFVRLYLGEAWVPAADILVLLAPMLALRSLASCVQTAAFVLKRARWLLVHNLAVAVLHGTAFVAALLLDLGVVPFLGLVTLLLAAEHVCFTCCLTLKVRSAALRSE